MSTNSGLFDTDNASQNAIKSNYSSSNVSHISNFDDGLSWGKQDARRNMMSEFNNISPGNLSHIKKNRKEDPCIVSEVENIFGQPQCVSSSRSNAGFIAIIVIVIALLLLAIFFLGSKYSYSAYFFFLIFFIAIVLIIIGFLCTANNPKGPVCC